MKYISEHNNHRKELVLMESYFKKIQLKQEVKSSVKAIERIIERVFDIQPTIHIVENNTSNFFGMTITPKTMDRLLMAILEDRSNKDRLYEAWRNEKEWVIEIDDILLYDKNLNATPSEIVAVLLHEMGHVIYSNTAISRAQRVIKLAIINSGAKYKKVLQHGLFRPLLELPFYESCNTKRFSLPQDVHKEEYIADKFAVKYGYGMQLESFITKLLKTQGNHLIDRPSGEMDDDVAILMVWTIENISLLEHRKDRLKLALEVEERRNPSKTIKTIIGRIRTNIFKSDITEPYQKLVEMQKISESVCCLMEKTSETSMKLKNPALMKSLMTKRKVEKITERELNLLAVEVDKIWYADDKVYVLDLIADFIEKIEYRLELIKNGFADRVPQSQKSLEDILNRAKEMEKRVLAVELRDHQYGLYVRYPKEYEG